VMEGLGEAVVSTLNSARQDLAVVQRRCMIAAIRGFSGFLPCWLDWRRAHNHVTASGVVTWSERTLHLSWATHPGMGWAAHRYLCFDGIYAYLAFNKIPPFRPVTTHPHPSLE
jgi:hypothetical protein